MAEGALSVLDLVDVVREALPGRATQVRARKDGSLRFVLYDAIAVAARPDDYGDGGTWGFTVLIGGDVEIATVLGEKLTLRGTRQEVMAALTTLDAYARHRLGADYLAAYRAAQSQPEVGS